MLHEFTIKSRCVASDEELYANITSALTRGLPVMGQYHEHEGTAVIVGSGPSVVEHVEAIREEQAQGHVIVALKDAHDWLIEREIIPAYAVAIDPQASRAECFTRKHRRVTYLIASQCHPALFDDLDGYEVILWHLYVRQNQAVPPCGTPLIAGGTTTGLRTITLLYTMGFRRVELYGFDSCLLHGVLRVNGDRPRRGDEAIHPITVDGKTFQCNPSMTAQAKEFQNLFYTMPDIQIRSHGEGLITAILEARAKAPKATLSFLHRVGPEAASFRYRAMIPAAELGASLNDPTADVLIYAKPDSIDTVEVKQALGAGKRLIADFCDDHFERKPYRDLLRLADDVTCSTEVLAQRIAQFGRQATVIPDPYEYAEVAPHCHGTNLLWFGHGVNLESVKRIWPSLEGYHVRVVSNAPETIPWSYETMLEEFARADIVLMPATAPYKSCNRTVEAVRQGCFVVAEPHPSLVDFLGIWIGDIQEGIEWARTHQEEANTQTAWAQTYVSQRYAPRIVACAWSRAIQGSDSISDVGRAGGPDGSTSMRSAQAPRSAVT